MLAARASFADVANELGYPAVRGVATRLVAGSDVVGVATAVASSLAVSESIPEDWLADVRVPFPAITVLFTEAFSLDETGEWVSGFTVTGDGKGRLVEQIVWLMVDSELNASVRPASIVDASQRDLVVNLMAWLGTHRQVRTARSGRTTAGSYSAVKRSAGDGGVVLITSSTETKTTGAGPSRPSRSHLRRADTGAASVAAQPTIGTTSCAGSHPPRSEVISQSSRRCGCSAP